MQSHLADMTRRNVVIGSCHHEDGLGTADTGFHEFNISDAAGEDLDLLIIDDLRNQSVQFGDIATVSMDFVIGSFEKVLYQCCTTVASRAENSVGGHGVSYDDGRCSWR